MTTHHLTSHLLKKDLWPQDLPKPASLHYLTLSGSVEGGTLTMLVFPDQSRTPALVLRLLRDDSELPHFLNERDTLQQFQTSPVLRNSVPRLLFCENLEGLWMLGESVVEGTPLKRLSQIDLAFEWLRLLAHETQKRPESPMSWSEAAKKSIAEFQNYFTVSAEEQDFFRKIEDALEASQPVVPMTYLVHGDFSRHNLFVSKTDEKITLKVIDWMSARWSPFPLHDACLFFTTYSLQNRKEPGLKGYLDAFSKGFFTSNEFSRLTKEKLMNHSQALGFNRELLPFFFALWLMDQAVLETKRMLALSKKGYIPRGAIYQGLSVNYEEALKNKLWTELFHFFVAHQASFLTHV